MARIISNLVLLCVYILVYDNYLYNNYYIIFYTDARSLHIIQTNLEALNVKINFFPFFDKIKTLQKIIKQLL